jgi:hypothetical protein
VVGRITLTNIRDESTFGYRMVRLVGRIIGTSPTSITTRSRTSGGKDEKELAWPVREGFFKAFVMLGVGENTIELSCATGHAQRELVLFFDPQLARSDHRLRLCYILPKDDDGRYVCPLEASGTPQEAARRIRFFGHMIQCFTAEKMAQAGHGYRTFVFVESPVDPLEPAVDMHVSSLTRAEIHALGSRWTDGGQAGWGHFAEELSTYRDRERTIDVCVLSMTERTNPAGGPGPDHGFLAHTALGGGHLALFGSGSLCTWAPGIEGLADCLLDERSCAAFPEIHDDSGGRGAFWAGYSTTAGAVLHEVGHCLGLHHTESGIMQRGFDDLNRFFSVCEPGSCIPITCSRERGAFWHAESVDQLCHSPYLRPLGKHPGWFRRLWRWTRRAVALA